MGLFIVQCLRGGAGSLGLFLGEGRSELGEEAGSSERRSKMLVNRLIR